MSFNDMIASMTMGLWLLLLLLSLVSSRGTSSVTDLGSKSNNSSIGDGLVHELGFDNFASVLSSSSFTLLLFYDPDDTSKELEQKRDILQRLADSFAEMGQPKAFFWRNVKIRFATLDIRRHTYLRRMYLRWNGYGVGQDYLNFYSDWDDLDKSDSPIPSNIVDSRSFMRVPEAQLPTYPSEWALMHGEYADILDCIDKSEKITTAEGDKVKVNPLQYSHVKAWLLQEIDDILHHVMQGPGVPSYPFGESEVGPSKSYRSFISIEKVERSYYDREDLMNTIDWEQLDQDGATEALREENDNSGIGFDAKQFEKSEPDALGESFYKFKLEKDVKKMTNAKMMKELDFVYDRFMTWTNTYENLWDENRRTFVDERTNYGVYLGEMNAQLRDVFIGVYDDLRRDDEEGRSLVSEQNIPDLAKYYEDMIFGFGRSPSALNEYLKENLYSASTTKEVSQLTLFKRIREYMEVREEVGRGEPYTVFFRALWVKSHAILAEFQLKMSRYYIKYLEKNPEEKKNCYAFAKMDVIDMKDPENFPLLSDYDKFESQYVAKRRPVILSNVNMTTHEFTLSHLVEKCGQVDVSEKIKISMAMGDKSVTRWGGLKKFVLPDKYRRLEEDDKLGDYISLEQFVALAERDPSLYLHDLGLRKLCNSLLWSKMPYDPTEEQLFRIPSVIGRYDLAQRLPLTGFADSWPSLFIGRKGSNSKLHTDAGGTGFWMYLVSGRKRWVVYDEAERPLLYERIDKSSFAADVLALNSTQNDTERKIIHDYFDATFPLLNLANAGMSSGYEIIQEPGQLIYLPPNTPHAVENLEDIVGISFNQVPKSGIAHHLHSLMHHRREYGSLEIALRFFLTDKVRAFSLAKSEDPLYTTLGEYIAQSSNTVVIAIVVWILLL